MRPFARIAWAALRGFVDHDGPALAAAIAYHALLSVFPFLLVATAIAAFFVDPAYLRISLARTLALYLPPQALDVVQANLEEALRTRGPAGIAATATLLWTSSAATGVARHALNRVWGVEDPRAYGKRKLLDILVTLLVGALLGTSLVGPVALGIAERLAPGRPVQWGSRILGVLLPFGLAFLAFLSAYRLLPNHRVQGQYLWPGALVGAILFEVARQGMFWGVGRLVHYPLVYGSLAGAVIFLMWGQVVAAIFLLGAEVSRSAHHFQASVRVPDHDEIP
jgi:membrane protein